MVHVVSIWLLVAAFLGAGVFNAIGTSEHEPISPAGATRAGGTS